jgi:hypothetical protein
MATEDVIRRLRDCLLQLEDAVGAPCLDARWLRLRCDDTLSFTGQLRDASVRQLKKDVALFVEELPELLPESLIRQVKSL